MVHSVIEFLSCKSHIVYLFQDLFPRKCISLLKNALLFLFSLCLCCQETLNSMQYSTPVIIAVYGFNKFISPPSTAFLTFYLLLFKITSRMYRSSDIASGLNSKQEETNQ